MNHDLPGDPPDHGDWIELDDLSVLDWLENLPLKARSDWVHDALLQSDEFGDELDKADSLGTLLKRIDEIYHTARGAEVVATYCRDQAERDANEGEAQ